MWQTLTDLHNKALVKKVLNMLGRGSSKSSLDTSAMFVSVCLSDFLWTWGTLRWPSTSSVISAVLFHSQQVVNIWQRAAGDIVYAQCFSTRKCASLGLCADWRRSQVRFSITRAYQLVFVRYARNHFTQKYRGHNQWNVNGRLFLSPMANKVPLCPVELNIMR